ncbi:LysE family transporter, partial [Salmonella enterica]|uniref:LysE family transporter n=1 Tax=Salmonella enterica TaxID=28901 RepID=UPI003CF2BCD7
GFLTNLLNPKATLFFVSLFATIVSHETPVMTQFAYGAVLAVFLAVWFSFVAVFLTTRSMRTGYERIGHW